jgi:hypothetical protein
MSTAKNIIEEHENRLAVITAIGIEVRALVVDKSTDHITSANDPDADRLVYAGGVPGPIVASLNAKSRESRPTAGKSLASADGVSTSPSMVQKSSVDFGRGNRETDARVGGGI